VIAVASEQRRAWVGLDALVSDGQQLTATQWLKQLGKRIAAPEDRPHAWTMTRTLVDARIGSYKYRFPIKVMFVATPDEIWAGHELLDALDVTSESLREFMITNQ